MRSSRHLEGHHSIEISQRGFAVFPRLETVVRSLADLEEPEGRISSGIPGLDEMMGGGIPAAEATAVLGASGSGKTALALGFIARGLADGERCLYISFQERVHQLVRKAASFGWDLAPMLLSGQLTIYHVPHRQLNLHVVGSVSGSRSKRGRRRGWCWTALRSWSWREASRSGSRLTRAVSWVFCRPRAHP
jgi:circadian clock protein KaiC